MNSLPFNKSFLAVWQLSDNNASDDELSLAGSVAVNEQFLEVIVMLGNDMPHLKHTKLTPINTNAHDGTVHHIN